MKILGKLVLVIIALSGIVLVYFVSWFWRALLIPLIILLLVDVLSNALRKKKD